MIQLDHLTKRFGDKTAVDNLSLTIKPGVITGFLGPNGAGKSTTIRLIMGMDRPSSGHITIDGKPFAQSKAPLRTIGALTDARGAQGGRSAYHHLSALAVSNGIGRSRVNEVLEIVGLTEVARQRVGSFSLGMGQRVGIAAALLGDPQTVILDEPVNGLDPEGIVWIRNLMKALAAEGRTVFVSSHLMSEMALTADHLVIIGRGRLMVDVPMAQFIAENSRTTVTVRSPRLSELATVLQNNGAKLSSTPDDGLLVEGLTSPQIGDLAGAAGIYLHQLAAHTSSLEEVFMEMTHGAVEYQATANLDSTHGKVQA